MRSGAPRGRQRGLSLIELMVALTLDLIIVAAVVGLFLQSSKYRADVERSNVQIENGRYAMQVLGDDLQTAGFYGHLNVGALGPWMTNFTARPDPCATTASALNPDANPAPGDPVILSAKPFLLPVQAYDGGAALSCLDDVKADTDVVVIRRVSSCVAGTPNCATIAGATYFQASSCNDVPGQELAVSGPRGMLQRYRLDTNLGNLDRRNRGCAMTAEVQQFLVRIYFIANNDNPGDGVPTLKRAELTAGGFVVIPIANGIEDLQLTYGIDNAPGGGDALPDAFVANPDTFGGCAAAGCAMANARNIVAANIHLLARSLTKRSGHTDTKTYTLGPTSGGALYVVGPFTDPYERHVFEGSVRLMNPSIRKNPTI